MAFLGAAVAAGAAAGGLLWQFRPKDPTFEVTSIEFNGFKVRFCTDSPILMAVIDVELVLNIKVTNPNVTPIEYTSTIMDIYYHDTLLGQAQGTVSSVEKWYTFTEVDEGGQAPQSTESIRVPAKLDGLQVTGHVKSLMKDVMKREMNLHSTVTIKGVAKLWKWRHNFEVHVNSDIKVDPIYMEVIEQENRVHLQLDPIVS